MVALSLVEVRLDDLTVARRVPGALELVPACFWKRREQKRPLRCSMSPHHSPAQVFSRAGHRDHRTLSTPG